MAATSPPKSESGRVDALAHGVADEAGDPDRAPTVFSVSLTTWATVLSGSRIRLIEQADLLVEGLEARFDDLGDELSASLLTELLRQHVLLARDPRPGRDPKGRAPAGWRRRRAGL